MRASGCIIDDNAVLDQFAKTNMQAYHDEVVFFHVSKSSGLWFAPWLKRRRKLSFVHYCKQPVRVHGTSFGHVGGRRRGTGEGRRRGNMDLEYKQKSLIVSFVCCWLPTKWFWGLRKKVLLESWTKAMLQCSKAGLMWRDSYVLACGNIVEVRLRSLISWVFVNISSRIMVRPSQSP